MLVLTLKLNQFRNNVPFSGLYTAEQNAGANLQDAYMEGMPWAYVTNKEISDGIKNP